MFTGLLLVCAIFLPWLHVLLMVASYNINTYILKEYFCTKKNFTTEFLFLKVVIAQQKDVKTQR